ncbi:two-component sensor histidine kinase [Asanoa ishikariensis]|uniref:histidine kinase n=1 Tax=Asanoa ishikariensis TaxID=137265 RepID=A0A1H3TFS1_9ACTN|nr:HAMP domain-containing sensor histidine kinase [Asanoa ishikariensis]GIF62650.1 two-component sensor histidine kinase [Asanoa ishikariensis]SDZ48189.1 two-component system, OmpR family, sensor kinase [Asanoa ishikariensis]
MIRPRRWRHWTLRARLVVAVATLTAFALLIANAIGLALLRRNLTDRIDEQLHAMGQAASQRRTWDVPPPPNPFPRGRFDVDRAMALVPPDGESPLLAVAAGVPPPELPTYAALLERAGGEPFTVRAVDGTMTWRLLVVANRDGSLTVSGVSLQAVDATADLLLAIDVVVMLVVLALLAVVAALVVRMGLRPLTRMERTSAEITGGDLSRRVRDANPHTEPGRLGIALNSMLDRIEAEVSARTTSERRLRQFVADASHELRTPLTSIRGFAELYRRGGAVPGPRLDEMMGRIEAEAARMGLLVEDLLQLARLDLQRRPERQPVDLLAIAADTIRDAHARQPDRPVELAALGNTADDAPFEAVTVLGDEHGLRQVLTNLVANALQHSTAPATVVVRVGRRLPGAAGIPPAAAVGEVPGDRPLAVLEVADAGPGVPVEHAERVFERLYRADPSRNRRSGGSGLGLSIVSAIVTSHGGRVELHPTTGGGATFRVLLPEDGRVPGHP